MLKLENAVAKAVTLGTRCTKVERRLLSALDRRLNDDVVNGSWLEYVRKCLRGCRWVELESVIERWRSDMYALCKRFDHDGDCDTDGYDLSAFNYGEDYDDDIHPCFNYYLCFSYLAGEYVRSVDWSMPNESSVPGFLIAILDGSDEAALARFRDLHW